LVKEILTHFPDARNSDDILYYLVCKHIDAISLNLPFKEVLLNRKSHGYPPYDCVARAGRKARERNPELAGSGNVEGYRKENEKIFHEYAKEII
jgi:hypothetical protein